MFLGSLVPWYMVSKHMTGNRNANKNKCLKVLPPCTDLVARRRSPSQDQRAAAKARATGSSLSLHLVNLGC